MKKSLTAKSLLLITLSALLLFGLLASSEGFKIEDGQRAYVTSIITAENVKGVEVRLAGDIVRYDCNRRTMSLTKVLVSGDGEGFYDTYFFDAWMTQTKMHCPLDKAINETIHSKPVFIKSFTNEHVNGKVVVSIVIPTGYKLDVIEVK